MVDLQELMDAQAELSRRTGFDPKDLFKEDGTMDLQMAGTWLNNYLTAMSSEVEELRDCTFWKHWCAEAKAGRRFELHDVQNARVEVVDMLCFWLSIASTIGLDAEAVKNLYEQKMAVNHTRQTGGYSMLGKTQDDNKRIRLRTH